MKLSLQRPYLAAYCLVQNETSVLVQRRYGTGYLDGFWALPSGFVEEGEHARAAASRELQEETSLVVAPNEWRFVCAMHRHTSFSTIDLFFTTDRFSGTPRISEPAKSDGLGFYSLTGLPQPLAGYIGVAVDYLQGKRSDNGNYHSEGLAYLTSTNLAVTALAATS